MISMTLKEAKKGFFDRSIVKDALDKTTQKNLSKFGAFVRRTAKTSIRKRKGISSPGKPPSSHTGQLRDMIFFLYDPKGKSVIIGPVLLNGTRASRSARFPGSAGVTVPQALEYGGTPPGCSGIVKPRPYMKPAFDKELAKLDDVWRNSLKAR